jgi:hypothetical protein
MFFDGMVRNSMLGYSIFQIRTERFILGVLDPQHSAILSPKAKPPTGRHFAQCPAGGLKRPQIHPLRPFCFDTRGGELAQAAWNQC